MSGSTIEKRSRNEILLKRSLLTREYLLRLNKILCNGCGLCVQNCPKKAIEWDPPKVENGRLVNKPSINFIVDSCIFCGECATLCPLDALKMEIDGEDIATIVKNEAFPVLLKEIKIAKEKCNPECKLVCQQECPTEAINIMVERSGKDLKINDVQVDESLCIYCKRCESVCPFQAIMVKKPFQGTVDLNTDLCPEGCMACVDICPAHALHLNEDGKPDVSHDFCIFCFACEKVCPKETIQVKRQWIFHSEIRSAVWLTALAKLTSVETVSKELASNSGINRATLAQGRETSILKKLIEESD
ncbi:MAG: 4Fe-4S dicluster domain-containing protein [Candidatus Bathyarchaeota archaeon]